MAKSNRLTGVRVIWCEAVSLSFLFGAFFESVSISLVSLALFGLVLHYLMSEFKSDLYVASFITFGWCTTTLLWGSWLDEMAATSYIAVVLTLITAIVSFWANLNFLRWPEIDQWFHSPSSDKE